MTATPKAGAKRGPWYAGVLAWVLSGTITAVAIVVFQMAGMPRGFKPSRYENRQDLAWWEARPRGAHVMEIQNDPRPREESTPLLGPDEDPNFPLRLRLPKSRIPEPAPRLLERMGKRWKGRIERFGWPVALDDHDLGASGFLEGLGGGRRSPGRRPPGEHRDALCVLPTSVEWWPLLASIAVLGAPLGGGLLTLTALRAWQRARRGRCPRCGYDLAGLPCDAPCPECGKGEAPGRGAAQASSPVA